MNLHLHIYIYICICMERCFQLDQGCPRRTIFGSWVRFGRCSRPSTSMGWQRCTPPKALASMGSSPNSVLLGANEGSWNSWKWKLWRPDQCETLWKSKKNARMMKTKTSSVSLLEWWSWSSLNHDTAGCGCLLRALHIAQSRHGTWPRTQQISERWFNGNGQIIKSNSLNHFKPKRL